MSALATVGILSLQILVTLSVIAYFARDHRDTGIVQRLIAPAVRMVALVSGLVLVIRNLPVLSGSHSNLVALLPCIPPIAGFAGVLAALHCKRRERAR